MTITGVVINTGKVINTELDQTGTSGFKKNINICPQEHLLEAHQKLRGLQTESYPQITFKYNFTSTSSSTYFHIPHHMNGNSENEFRKFQIQTSHKRKYFVNPILVLMTVITQSKLTVLQMQNTFNTKMLVQTYTVQYINIPYKKFLPL
jgi:hypothetical protein